MNGTCPSCGYWIPVVNHAVKRTATGATVESGYLARHSRKGVAGGADRVPRKCRGSFGWWTEKRSPSSADAHPMTVRTH